MKAVILDDEIYCTDVLGILIQKHCPEIELAGVFNDATLALDFLSSHDIDVLFLDIEMPRTNGFDLLKRLGSFHFKVIFTTAYDQYALKAFRFNAIDYLLKPIDKNELMEAVGKLRTKPAIMPDVVNYLSDLHLKKTPERILLPIGQEILFVAVDDIVCCEADGSYCKIYCLGQPKPLLLSKNLSEIEDMLSNPAFIRCHASWLIQERHIRKLLKGEGMQLVMVNEIFVPVARSKKQEVMARLKL